MSFSSACVFLLLQGSADPCDTAYYPPLASTAVCTTSRVWAAPLSLATTQGILSFPAGTKMFQFPACPQHRLCVQRAVTGLLPAGFPHSETLGSALAHSSPRLFAVYHVLLRPLTPRHPPNALSIFTTSYGDLDACLHVPASASRVLDSLVKVLSDSVSRAYALISLNG